MFHRASLIACGALLGLALAVGTVSATANLAESANHLEYVTFSGPVSLPGVALGSGTYSFEVANPDTSSDIVLIRNKATRQVCFLGFTHRVDRPADMRSDRSIVLGEAPAGVAPPIMQWYPIGESTGHEFLYKSR
jgi:hypothetical protein